MKQVRLPLIFALAMFSLLQATGSSAQEFQAYEGKNAIREGEGGTKKTVDGVDFWSDGAPPYRFKLIGFISDRRHKTGLVGMISMSNLEGSIAEVAKKNGGDAVIQVSSEAETVGFVTNNSGDATGWSTGSAAKVQKQNSKFAVIKYMKEPNDAGSAQQPAAKSEAPSQSDAPMQ